MSFIGPTGKNPSRYFWTIQALVPEHIHLTIPVSQVIGLVAPLLPIEPSSVYVSLWARAPQP